jgi:hypothetical protein
LGGTASCPAAGGRARSKGLFNRRLFFMQRRSCLCRSWIKCARADIWARRRAQSEQLALFKQAEQVESPGAQSGLGGSQEGPDVALEPTFPTGIRARTRSVIGLSVGGGAGTTSVTADSGKLDEGEAVVLTIYPLPVGVEEPRLDQKFEVVGKSGYRQVMEGPLEGQDEECEARELRVHVGGTPRAPCSHDKGDHPPAGGGFLVRLLVLVGAPRGRTGLFCRLPPWP